tara:strand:- start:49 stop:543 length:495 start_codon:yes stop_codon:yes gene_type:complete
MSISGKIYKMINLDNGLIYIGSTIQTLPQRKTQHKSHRNTETRNFNFDNIEMSLIKNIICNSKLELRKEEQKYINEYDCVNKYKAYSTEEEKKELVKKHNKKQTEKTKLLKPVSNGEKTYSNIYHLNRSKKMTCECGNEITKSSYYKHIKSKKHITFSHTSLEC